MKIRNIANALKNLAHHKTGRCNICGRKTLFLCFDHQAIRNTMSCLFCHSTTRNRHIAKVLLQIGAPKKQTLKAFSQTTKLHIYHTHIYDVLYHALKYADHFTCSSLIPNTEEGSELETNTYCQNLEHLTFADDSFDMIISEDVLEHVRKDELALHEIFRVLRPGGYHIFTIPCSFDSNTITRVDTSTNQDVFLMEKEFHGDVMRGHILAYRNYGKDFLDVLSGIGFKTRVDTPTAADKKNGIMGGYVFISQKPETSTS